MKEDTSHIIAGRHGRRKVTFAVDYLNIWIVPIEALTTIDEKSVTKTSIRCLRVEVLSQHRRIQPIYRSDT